MSSKKRMSYPCDRGAGRLGMSRTVVEALGRNILLQKSDKEGLDDSVCAV